MAKEKNAVRNYLREVGQEDQWTLLQGEVYGSRILEAEAYNGMLDVLSFLQKKSIPMFIVSHKTKTPYMGLPIDLHESARNWLDRNHFTTPDGLNWRKEQIFFELTKSQKIQRILELGCTHYIDDLPEILELLPDTIQKILFAPDGSSNVSKEWIVFHQWTEFPFHQIFQ